MSKHTPGPWTFVYRGGDTDQGGFVGSDGVEVCWFGDSETYYPTEGFAPNEHDTRLMEAAPLLLEALRDMVSDRDCLREATVNFARAAIAAATGES